MSTKRKTSRIMALLLTLCMVLTMLPAMSMTAFAAAPGDSADNPYIADSFAKLKTALESYGESEIKYIKTTTFTDEVTISSESQVGLSAINIYDGTKHLELSGTVTIKPKSSIMAYGDFIDVRIGSTLNITGDGQLLCQFSGNGTYGGDVIDVSGTLNTSLGKTGKIAAIPGGEPHMPSAINTTGENATVNLRGGTYVGLVEKGANLRYSTLTYPREASAISVEDYGAKVTFEDVICTGENYEEDRLYEKPYGKEAKTRGFTGNLTEESVRIISGKFDSDQAGRGDYYNKFLAWGSTATYDKTTDTTTVTAGTPITDVTITGLDAPKPGNVPDTTVTVTSNPAGKGKLYSITWYDLATGKAMGSGEKFEKNGEGYTARVRLYPDEGYRFKLDSNDKYTGNATVNGENKSFRKEPSNVVTINGELKLCDNIICADIFFYEEPTAEPPQITTSSLPEATYGTLYDQTITATGTEPMTWKLESGSLPKGLELNDNVISGTPTEAGTSTFTVKATNSAGSASQSLTINVNASAPVITTHPVLPNGNPGEDYNQKLEATGTAPITWSIESGALPDGLTLDVNTGVISGKPTTSGSSDFTVKATNSAGSSSKKLNITVNIHFISNAAATVTTPVVGESPDFAPVSGNSSWYDVKVDYWCLNEASYTRLNDTSTFEGGKEYKLRLIFTAKDGYSFNNNTAFTINGQSASSYSTETPAKYAYREVTFTVPDTATPLTGTVTITGTAECNVQLFANCSNLASGSGSLSYQWKRGSTSIDGANENYYITVKEDIGNVITCEVKSDTLQGVLISNGVTIEKSSQSAPLVKGENPKVEGEKGKILETDTTMEYANNSSFVDAKDCDNTETIVEPGTYYVRYKETDTSKAGTSKEVKITAPKVLNNLSVKVTVPTEGANPTNLSYKPAHTSYYDTDIDWIEVDGGVEGNTLDNTDTFEAGKTYRFRLTLKTDTGYIFGKDAKIKLNGSEVTVEEKDNVHIKFYYDFTVPAATTGNQAPIIITDTLPKGTVGEYYSEKLDAVSEEDVTWELAEGTLPDGLELNKNTGAIDGIPTTVGTADFKVKATNSAGNVTQSLSITIDPAPPTTEIATANITVTAAKTGAKPSNASTTDTAYTVASTIWDPVDDPFKEGTAYTVVVELEASGTDRFTSNTKFYINGQEATLISPNPISGNVDQVRISYKFPKTETQTGGGGGGVLTYTLTFNTNGGSKVNSVSKTSGTSVDLAGYKPTRDGYTFDGWYADAKLTDKVTSVKLTKDTTVYAKWVQNSGAGLPFTDVKSGDWFYNDVVYVFEKGLMNGTSSTTFSPLMTTTRGMIVTVLYRQAGSPTVSSKCPFNDVKSGMYYETPITWAAANGIVKGYSADKFGPDDPITREQMAAILYRYAQYKGVDVSAKADLNQYKDAAKVSDWAKDAIAWTVQEGIFNGVGDSLLSPETQATRAQIAAILHRFCENIAK